MSINWVMLSDDEGFVRLPGEQCLYTSPPRTSIALHSLNKYPGREPFSVSSSTGFLYLTSRRIIYLPNPATPTFQSFAAPLSHLHDTHVTAPWVGPNAWVAAVQPVPSGGIPAHLPAIEARVTFKDGGAYDFHDRFCRVKERVVQALEARALSGAATAAGAHVGEEVHLEQLPAYEALGGVAGGNTVRGPSTVPPLLAPRPTAAPPAPSTAPTLAPATATTTTNAAPSSQPQGSMPSTATTTPDEPPPGYEEAQRTSIADELERGLRFRSARGRDGGGTSEE